MQIILAHERSSLGGKRPDYLPELQRELIAVISKYVSIKAEDIKVHLETPDQVFAEYFINHESGITGKKVHQQFFGHLEAANGKIKRLREAIDVVLVAEAVYPNGLTDVVGKRAA